MHKLDDKIAINPDLLRRFGAEARLDGGDGRYFALMQLNNGNILTHQIVGPKIEIHGHLFAVDLLNMLNRQLHHDGAWSIVFSHYADSPLPGSGGYSKFTLLWMDRDGDVGFPVDCDEPLSLAISWGLLYWVEHCETAWKLWHHAMRNVLAPRANETFKRAQGEKRPTVH